MPTVQQLKASVMICALDINYDDGGDGKTCCLSPLLLKASDLFMMN